MKSASFAATCQNIDFKKKVSMEPPQYDGDLLGLQKREYLAKAEAHSEGWRMLYMILKPLVLGSHKTPNLGDERNPCNTERANRNSKSTIRLQSNRYWFRRHSRGIKGNNTQLIQRNGCTNSPKTSGYVFFILVRRNW